MHSYFCTFFTYFIRKKLFNNDLNLYVKMFILKIKCFYLNYIIQYLYILHLNFMFEFFLIVYYKHWKMIKKNINIVMKCSILCYTYKN